MSAVACVFLVFIAVGLAGFAAAVIRSTPPPRRDRDDSSGGGGGSQPRVPPGRPPEPSGASPDWWPRFERELADYVSRRNSTLSAD